MYVFYIFTYTKNYPSSKNTRKGIFIKAYSFTVNNVMRITSLGKLQLNIGNIIETYKKFKLELKNYSLKKALYSVEEYFYLVKKIIINFHEH